MSLAARVAKLRELANDDSPRLRRILHQPQFTRKDVIEVTGVAEHQLHNWVSRRWITLSGEQHPGKGRRRLYTGKDAISIAFGLQLQPFGMMQVANRLSRARHMSKRASSILLDRTFQWGRAVAIMPSPEEGKWLYVPFGPGTARERHDFRAAVILDVDRLILETLERLAIVVQGGGLTPLTPEMPQKNAGNGKAEWSEELLGEDEGDEYLVSTMATNPLEKRYF